ncbi:MAG: hypothetical protein ACOC0M_11460, partial [Halomonas sp.]
VAAGGNAGVGASAAVSYLSHDVSARVEDLGSAAERLTAERVEVLADNNALVISLAGSAGVATGGKGFGLSGSVGVNLVNTTTRADVVNSHLDLGDSSHDEPDVNVIARDRASIWSLAGAVGVGGAAGFGAGISVNYVGGDSAILGDDARASAGVQASLEGGSLRGAEDVRVVSSVTSLIRSLALGVGASNKVAGSGSVAVNLIDTQQRSRLIDADIADSAGGLVVDSQERSQLITISGAAAGAGKVALAGSVAVNVVNHDQLSQVSGGTVDVAGDARVAASSEGLVVSVALGGAAAGKVGLAGAITVNAISGQTAAVVGDGAGITAGGAITVQALSNNQVVVIALGAAGGGTVAGGVSASTVQTQDAILARVEGGARLVAETGNVEILAGLSDGAERDNFALQRVGVDVDLDTYGAGSAEEDEDDPAEAGMAQRDTSDLDMSSAVINISFAGAGGGTAAGAGAVGLNWLQTSVRADVIGSSTRITAGDSIAVQARDRSALLNFGFAIAGGGTVAGGAAITFNYIGGDPSNPSRSLQSEDDVDTSQDLFTTSTEDDLDLDLVPGEVAAVVDGATLEADTESLEDDEAGRILVDAAAESILFNFSAGGSGGGTAALSGSIGINFIKHRVTAAIDGGAEVTGRSVEVLSTLAPISINVAGAASGAGTVGIAGASATTDYNSAIQARVSGDGTLVTATDGDIRVEAELRRIDQTESVLDAEDIAQAEGEGTDSDAEYQDDDGEGGEGAGADKGPEQIAGDADDAPDMPSPTEAGDQIFTVAISGAASGTASIAGALSLNWMRSTAEAEVLDGATLVADKGDVKVRAADRLGMNSFTIAAGASGSFSVAGYMAYNF